MSLKLLGYRVREYVSSAKIRKHRITVEFSNGIPTGSVFQTFEENGWIMELQPMPANLYRDTLTYLVVFVSLPDTHPKMPERE